jgi:uncharacterized protein involved in exopolysaccharide biosynthesis
MERLRGTPFITVIDSPEQAAHRTGPRLPIAIPVGLLVGSLLGIPAVAAMDSAARRRA